MVEKKAEKSRSFLKNLYLFWIWRRRDPYEFVWYSSKSTFPMRCRPDSLPLHTVLQSLAAVLTGLNIRGYVCSFSFSTILWLWIFRNKQQKHHSPGMQLYSLYYSTWSLPLKWPENRVFFICRGTNSESCWAQQLPGQLLVIGAIQMSHSSLHLGPSVKFHQIQTCHADK